MSEVTQLVESLHPHEVKVLRAFDTSKDDDACTEEDLAKRSGLEIAQVGSALGRLQIKGLVGISARVPRTEVSLTETGLRYFQHYTPMVRIISALKKASDTGAQLTIRDIQTREKLDSSEVSEAIGELKQEGVIGITAGGIVEPTGRSSSTAELLQKLIRFLHEGTKPLLDFTPPEQAVLKKFYQKRGKPNEPFRVDERESRRFGLTENGRIITRQLLKEGTRNEITFQTPELLKDGRWPNKRCRKDANNLHQAP